VTAVFAGFDHQMPIFDSDRKPGMAVAIDATSVSSSGDCEQEGWMMRFLRMRPSHYAAVLSGQFNRPVSVRGYLILALRRGPVGPKIR
jgi:hypothetical protein